MALQARVNGELGARIGDGVAAALISFGTGLVLLCVVVALVLDAVVPSGPAVTPADVVACGLTLSAALLAAR